MPPLPSAGKKRKPKASAVNSDQASKSGKKRKLVDNLAEDTAPNEAKGKIKGANFHSKRPPKGPQEEAGTPSGQGQKLRVRLGSTIEVSHHQYGLPRYWVHSFYTTVQYISSSY